MVRRGDCVSGGVNELQPLVYQSRTTGNVLCLLELWRSEVIRWSNIDSIQVGGWVETNQYTHRQTKNTQKGERVKGKREKKDRETEKPPEATHHKNHVLSPFPPPFLTPHPITILGVTLCLRNLKRHIAFNAVLNWFTGMRASSMD